MCAESLNSNWKSEADEENNIDLYQPDIWQFPGFPIVAHKSIAKQRSQHTCGQQYNRSVFFVSA
jgi:hypothetical protein